MAIDRIWSYTPDSGYSARVDPTGYSVAATDGTIGRVEREADHYGMRHLVVDTGVWKFGKSVLVPVGVVTAIDPEAGRISLACTESEVKEAPRFRTDSETMDAQYLATVGEYYHRLPQGGTTPA